MEKSSVAALAWSDDAAGGIRRAGFRLRRLRSDNPVTNVSSNLRRVE